MRTMRPFISFFGGKWKAAKHYPVPLHDKIIEPFSGSAGYSLRYPDKQVILCERDPAIASVWRFLIGASKQDILDIPLWDASFKTIADMPVSPDVRAFVGFWLNAGCSAPSKSPSKWMRLGTHPGCYWSEVTRERLANQVERIDHWQLIEGDYADAPDVEATWFIDSPYADEGIHYKFGSKLLDYKELGIWCQMRYGQVIVCENEGATWLPFQAFRTIAGTPGKRRSGISKEVIWYKEKDQ